MTAAARWYHTTTTTTTAAAAADASADVHISQQLAGQHRRPTCARMPPRASAPLHPAWMTIADDRATRYSAHRATTFRLGPHAVQRPRDGAHHSEQPDDGARIVMQSLPCALSNSRLVPRTLGTRLDLLALSSLRLLTSGASRSPLRGWPPSSPKRLRSSRGPRLTLSPYAPFARSWGRWSPST
jgi:hypothetical protein